MMFFDPDLERAYCPICKEWTEIPSGASSEEAKRRVATLIYNNGCQLCRLKKTFGKEIPPEVISFLKKTMPVEKLTKLQSPVIGEAGKGPWTYFTSIES